MILLKSVTLLNQLDNCKQDILCCGGKIIAIAENIQSEILPDLELINGQGKIAVPGFIDQHVHIIGGGGDNGFASRVSEISLTSCIKNGVTTVVGVLGTDSTTKSVEALLSKAKALRKGGITAYCLTGAFRFPSPTICGSVTRDICFINEVLGVKSAIADHRCSFLTDEELTRLASEVRIGSLLAHKKPILHLHVGTNDEGIEQINRVIEKTSLPISIFHPTHIRKTTKGTQKFLESGGYLDFTTGEGPDFCVENLLHYITDKNENQITMSSDAGGGLPIWNEKKELIGISSSNMQTLLIAVRLLIKKYRMNPKKAFHLITETVAKAIGLFPTKGVLDVGSDADIVILDQDYQINTVIARGKVMLRNGEMIVRDFYTGGC